MGLLKCAKENGTLDLYCFKGIIHPKNSKHLLSHAYLTQMPLMLKDWILDCHWDVVEHLQKLRIRPLKTQMYVRHNLHKFKLAINL